MFNNLLIGMMFIVLYLVSWMQEKHREDYDWTTCPPTFRSCKEYVEHKGSMYD